MNIHHTHPTHETPKAEAETLSALYRSCIRQLCNSKLPWPLPQHTSPLPSAR